MLQARETIVCGVKKGKQIKCRQIDAGTSFEPAQYKLDAKDVERLKRLSVAREVDVEEPEAEQPEGTSEADASAGDTSEEQSSEGDASEGEASEGDTSDGDTSEDQATG